MMSVDRNDLIAGPNALGFMDPAALDVIIELEERATADEKRIGEISTILGKWDDWADGDALIAMTTASAEAFLPVSRDVGRLLFTLARASNAQRIVEYGTSLGMSTIYLASAARFTGGRVIGTENSETKVTEASLNLTRAGLGQYVDILPGDARETLLSVEGPIDFLLLDGWIPLYLEIFQLLEPRLVPGSIVICDTVRTHADKLAPFYDYVASKQDEYVRMNLPLDDGVDVIVRL